MKITGVTGTKGKTTVTYLIDAVYEEKYAKPSAVIGTLKYRIGKKRICRTQHHAFQPAFKQADCRGGVEKN